LRRFGEVGRLGCSVQVRLWFSPSPKLTSSVSVVTAPRSAVLLVIPVLRPVLLPVLLVFLVFLVFLFLVLVVLVVILVLADLIFL
jgi:hypothetical protein